MVALRMISGGRRPNAYFLRLFSTIGYRIARRVVVRGDSHHMFEGDSLKLVLFLHIKFELRDKEISGYVALLMDIPSLDELRLLIGQFLSSVTQVDEPSRKT